MMTSTSGRRCFTADRSSSPESCGILMSRSATSKSSCARRWVAAIGDSSPTTSWPFFRRSDSSARSSVGSSSTTSTRAGFSMDSVMTRLPLSLGLHGRQLEHEARAAVGRLLELDRAAVLLRDLVADGEAEPGPLPLCLGGEERLEDALRDLRADARAGVRDRQLH